MPTIKNVRTTGAAIVLIATAALAIGHALVGQGSFDEAISAVTAAVAGLGLLFARDA